jgi:hypothetical protein
MLELQIASTKQCAWCWMTIGETGSYTVQPGHKLKSATHGICPPCKERVKAEIDRTIPVLIAA